MPFDSCIKVLKTKGENKETYRTISDSEFGTISGSFSYRDKMIGYIISIKGVVFLRIFLLDIYEHNK